MKVKFSSIFRWWMILLFVTCGWSLWAAVQSTNAQAEATPGTAEAPMVVRLEHIDRHYLTFGFDRIEALRTTEFLGEPLWKPITFLVYILLAFLIAKVCDWIIGKWLKKLASRTETNIDDLLLQFLHGPVKVIVFVLLINIGLSIFDWSERTRTYLSKLFILVVAGALTYVTLKVMNLLLDIWRGKTTHEADRKFDDQLFSVLRKSANAFVIIVALLVTAQNLGVNITAAITSLSIGGLAVGLAAQDTLANLFGAVAVFVDKPFRVGDAVKFDNVEGTVEIVGLRSTRVRNPDGHMVAIPNKIMGSTVITNITERPHLKTTMNLVLSQQLPAEKIERALALLNDIYGKDPMTEDVLISFNRFVTRHINIQIIHWWKGTDNRKYLAGMQAMNLKVKQQFDAEGILFA